MTHATPKPAGLIGMTLDIPHTITADPSRFLREFFENSRRIPEAASRILEETSKDVRLKCEGSPCIVLRWLYSFHNRTDSALRYYFFTCLSTLHQCVNGGGATVATPCAS